MMNLESPRYVTEHSMLFTWKLRTNERQLNTKWTCLSSSYRRVNRGLEGEKGREVRWVCPQGVGGQTERVLMGQRTIWFMPRGKRQVGPSPSSTGLLNLFLVLLLFLFELSSCWVGQLLDAKVRYVYAAFLSKCIFL